MMLFKENIDKKEYDVFLKEQKLVSFMQDSRWARVKNNFESCFCGVYENDNLILACSILIRKVGFLYLAYAPRGPVGDLSNKKVLEVFTNGVKSFLKKKNVYVLTMDPNVLESELFYKEITTKEKVDGPVNYSINHEKIHQNLLELGYRHKGFVKDITESYQPRYHMVMGLCDKDNNLLSVEEVIRGYKSKVRYYLGSFHEKRGVFFEKTSDPKRLDDFMSILNCTEERQNISLRSKEYFERILKEFKEDSVILFGYLDLKKYKTFLEENNGKEEEKKEIDEYLKKQDTLLLSASLVILPSNKGIRMSEYLYAGNNLLFPNLRISTAMVYEILKLSIENNCHYCNLGGISGTYQDHLSEFKSKFNPIVFEYLGEYDLVLKKVPYCLVNTALKIRKKIRKK